MSENFHYNNRKRKKFYTILAISVIFIAILVYLIATAFYPNFSLTGKIVEEIKPNSTIEISADLTIPAMEIDGNFENVEIRGNSESFFYVESEKFKLDSKNNYIVLNNFSGKISFDSEKINKLSGKSSKVFFNGIPIEPKTKSALKVSIDDDFYYSLANIENEVEIRELTYVSSGNIILNNGKNVFSLENETITLKDFVGDLRSENNKFKLNGFIKRLDIQGKSGISVSS